MSIHPITNTLVSNRWCIYSYFCSSTHHQVLCDSDSVGTQESSGGFCRVLEDSGEFWKIPESSGRFQRVLEDSREFWKVPKCCRMFKKSPESTRGLWNFPEYSITELSRRKEIIRERSRWSNDRIYKESILRSESHYVFGNRTCNNTRNNTPSVT